MTGTTAFLALMGVGEKADQDNDQRTKKESKKGPRKIKAEAKNTRSKF